VLEWGGEREMKVITKVKFRDIHTNEIHEIGDVFTCSKARFNEILTSGEFVEEYKEEKDEK
jgi:hypothetical protein